MPIDDKNTKRIIMGTTYLNRMNHAFNKVSEIFIPSFRFVNTLSFFQTQPTKTEISNPPTGNNIFEAI